MSKNQPVSVFVNFWVATFPKVTNVPDAPGEILGGPDGTQSLR